MKTLSYAFIWPAEALDMLKLEGAVSSRFFDLDSVYDAVTGDLSMNTQNSELVYLGAYSTPVVDYVEGSQSVCVAVCKEVDALKIMHVETCEDKLDKAWVLGLVKHLKAKKTRAITSDSLNEDDKRDLLLKLRGVIEQHRLLISSRYTTLFDDLTEFSYKKPSSGYVYALALAVDLALP
jgi:hypothetical protein